MQRRILEYAGGPFKIINIPNWDRTLVWKLTRQRYYGVPIIKDGKAVVFETDDDSQVIAKYLDNKLQSGLFPAEWRGIQTLLWRYIENDIEGLGFKLNDIYYEEMIPPEGRLGFLRHKERKFGRGCIEAWRKNQKQMLLELTQKLIPCEQMVAHRDFLLDSRPRFVDFDLYGMLGNFLYTGHYALPKAHPRLKSWYARMSQVKLACFQ